MGISATVEVKSISDELLAQIRKEFGINDNSPVLALAIYRDGTIIVGTGAKDFNAALVGKPIKEITSVTPACIVVARGSTVTNVNIGGTSITHEWGP